VKGTKLEEFAIAGEDRKWYWADAHIEGDTVLVSSPSVPNPKEVRYAWQSNPAATLFNGAGLPAGPFRPIHGPASQRVRDHTDSVDKVRMNRLRKFARRQLDMLLGIPAKLNSIPEEGEHHSGPKVNTAGAKRR